MVSVVLLFAGYMMDFGGLKGAIDGVLAGLHHSAHEHDRQVASAFIVLLPFVALALGIVLTWILFGGFGRRKNRRKTARAVQTGAMTLHEFAEAARAHEVCAKVARAAYRTLAPKHPETMRGLLEADLRKDLGMTDAQVQELSQELLERADRSAAGRPCDGQTLLTLLRSVEARPDLSQARAMRMQPVTMEARTLVPLPLKAASATRDSSAARASQNAVAAAANPPASKPAAVFVRPARLAPGQWTVTDATTDAAVVR